MTVNPLPVAGTITGTGIVCLTHTTSLSASVTGGSWSSSSAAIASVSGTGVVTGLALGTATISYTVTNSCGSATATTIVTVNALVDRGIISGADTVCQGDTIHLSETVTTGTWSSSNTAVATVDVAGIVTGVAPGTATIRYIVSNICSTDTATKVVAVKSAADCATSVDPVRGKSVAVIRLFPNPTNGVLSIETSVAGTLSIFSLDGKAIASYNVNAATTALSLPNKIAGGIYMCRFIGNDGASEIVRLVYEP
jgi:hypothetical protein